MRPVPWASQKSLCVGRWDVGDSVGPCRVSVGKCQAIAAGVDCDHVYTSVFDMVKSGEAKGLQQLVKEVGKIERARREGSECKECDAQFLAFQAGYIVAALLFAYPVYKFLVSKSWIRSFQELSFELGISDVSKLKAWFAATQIISTVGYAAADASDVDEHVSTIVARLMAFEKPGAADP